MASTDQGDPFISLNAAFLQAYERAVARTLARTRPILVVNRPKLVLLRAGGRDERTVLPAAYDRLKAAAHVPLAIYALLAPFNDESLADGRLDQLLRLRTLTQEALAAISGTLETQASEALQHLLTAGLEFMDKVLQARSYENNQLTGFLRSLRPSIETGIRAAVRLEIDAYHAQMQAWRAQMSVEEWRNLWVVVVEAPQAHQADLGLVYFSRLLGEPREGGRIIFAESLYLSEDEQWALDHVAKQVLDTAVSTAFFADPQRLDRDILGDAAIEYVNNLFAGSAESQEQ